MGGINELAYDFTQHCKAPKVGVVTVSSDLAFSSMASFFLNHPVSGNYLRLRPLLCKLGVIHYVRSLRTCESQQGMALVPQPQC